MKTRLRRFLIWVAALGPPALFIADKVAHLFGICIGG